MARNNDNERGPKDTGPKDGGKQAETPRLPRADTGLIAGPPGADAGTSEGTPATAPVPDSPDSQQQLHERDAKPLAEELSPTEALAEIRQMKEELLRGLKDLDMQRAAFLAGKSEALAKQALADEEAAKDSKDTVTIVNQRGGTTTFHGQAANGDPLKMELTPGANLVPLSTWQRMKDSRDVQAHLKAGMDPMRREGIRDVSASRTVDMNDTEALLVVRNIRSEERLALATRGEKRPHVLDAAKSQERKLVDLRKRATGAEE